MNNKASNIACRAETGRYPLIFDIIKIIFKSYNHSVMSIDLRRNGKTSFYTNHIKMHNYYNIYREYKRIQENTKECRRIQGNTEEYRGIQGNTGGYGGKQEITGETKKTQGDTREYKGILGISITQLVHGLMQILHF